MSLAKKLLLATLGLITSILGIEFLLHLGGVWPNISWEWQLQANARAPSASSILTMPRFIGDNHYQTAAGERVIVALGDSFTEGYPVGPDAAWPALLEKALDGANTPTRVINMGMGNSGPQQQVRMLEDYALSRINPDDVIWALYANDLGDDLIQNTFEIENDQLKPLDGSEHWIYRRLELWRSLPVPTSLRKRSALIRILMHRWEQTARPRRSRNLGAEQRGLDLLLERVADRAARDGFRLWLVLIVPEAAYLHDQDPQNWSNNWIFNEHKRLRKILKHHPDVLEIDFSDDGRSSEAFFVDTSRDGAEPGDHHFNEEGQRLMTRKLLMLLD